MSPLHFAPKRATLVLWAGTVLVLLTMAPAATRADVIIGNLSAGDGGKVQINDDSVAVSFTMGSQAYSISDVQIRLQGNVPSQLTYQIRDDASGQPSNNVLLTFNGQSAATTATVTYTFNAGSPFTAAANTTYWLVGFSSQPASWVDSSPQTNPSGSAATFGQYEQSPSSTGLGPWSSLSSDAPKFQLDGTPTGSPEPSSLVLVGTVTCVAAAVGWRRRRQQRQAHTLPRHS